MPRSSYLTGLLSLDRKKRGQKHHNFKRMAFLTSPFLFTMVAQSERNTSILQFDGIARGAGGMGADFINNSM